jgi:alkylhydroperoxidase family enzyme
MRAGASADKLAEVASARTSGAFSERERAALEYAETMTTTGAQVTEELFQRLRSHLSEGQIVELTSAVALENFRSKFNVALGIEAQGFCVTAVHSAAR